MNHNDMTTNTLSLLLEAVDGAHYVYRDEDGDTLYVWHGGAIVNIYSITTGENFDCFTRTKMVPNSDHDLRAGYLNRDEIHAAIIDHRDNL